MTREMKTVGELFFDPRLASDQASNCLFVYVTLS